MAQRRNLLFIICLLALGAFVFFYRLGEKDMWTRLESEAAVAGRDMLDTGRILIPHFFDQPFVDNRPPGAFWLVAASYKLTGRRDEWAARLPSALAALGCVLLVYAMGRRAANETAGFLSALVLLGMLTFVLMGRMSQQDMLLTLWTMLGHWAFWRSLDEGSSAFRYVLAFQIFLGLGAITKGPAVVLTVLFPLAVYVIYSRRWRDVKWLMLVSTLPVSLALTLWWYLYVWIEWPSMRQVLVSRFVGQSERHIEPFYFYFLHIPELLGPATLLLPLLPIGWFKASPAQRRGPLGLFLISALSIFFVMCLFASRRTHYLVPLLPVLSLALGLVMANQRYDEGRYLTRSTLVLATLNPLIIVAWVFMAPDHLRLESVVREWAAFAVLAGMAAWSWILLRAGRRSTAWRISWVSCIVALAFFLGDIYQRAGDLRSPRKFAENVAKVVPSQTRLGSLSSHAALLFYVGRPMEFLDVSSVKGFLASPNHYLIVVDDDFLRIDEKRRQIVLSQSPYRQYDKAYLLRGGPSERDTRGPIIQ
jgi:4-amino-4-deoxy-L-arabinose transferase-like glycosyltransferase